MAQRREAVLAGSRQILLGAHTSVAGGFYKALERGAETGCDLIQIFCKSNQQWAAARISEADLERWWSTRARLSVIPALVHTSYLLNLASTSPETARRSERSLLEELERTAALGIPYLVLHPGSHGGLGEAQAIRLVARALDRVLEAHARAEPRIALENTAGQGTSLGYRFEHLRDIIGGSRYPGRLGVCLDTCHLMSAGYAMGSLGAWRATVDGFTQTVGLNALVALHLNDSKTPLGSRRDLHQHIGCGTLGLSFFHRLLSDPRFGGKPMVLETPKPVVPFDRANLSVLRALANTARIGRAARRRFAELQQLARS